MKKQLTLGIASAVMVASLTFTSCRKKSTESVKPDTDQSTAKDNNISESINNDIVSMGSQVADNSTLQTFKTSQVTDLLGISTASVSITGSTITVDFGTFPATTTGQDGRVRSGQLIYDYSASTPSTSTRYRNPGFKMSVKTTAASPYVVDGNTVTIVNKTVQNTTPSSIPTGTNPGTNLTWAINANVTIAKLGGGSINWTCNRTKELLNTNDSACYHGQSSAITWGLAKIKINGSATGTNVSGENFSVVATNLVRDFTCPVGLRRHFVSGQVAYTPGNKLTRVIDYGSGTCDNNATLTVNSVTYLITLP
jgi:hypothetical protein